MLQPCDLARYVALERRLLMDLPAAVETDVEIGFAWDMHIDLCHG